jgi:hypothetical protein
MGQMAGPNDGWKILQALGFEERDRIRKATIAIEVGRPVVVTVEKFVSHVIDGLLEDVTEEYELRKVGQ